MVSSFITALRKWLCLKAGWGIPSGHEDQCRKLLPGQWRQPVVLLAVDWTFACRSLCVRDLSAGVMLLPSIALAKQLEHTLLTILFHAAVRGWSGNWDLSWCFSLVHTPRHTISPPASPSPYSNGTVLSVFDLQLIVLDPPVSNKLNPAQNSPFLALLDVVLCC